MDDPNAAQEGGELRRLVPTVAAVCFGWLFSAVDIVLLILFQRSVAESLGVDIQWVRIAIGVGLLGSAVGGVLFAQLGDRVGRVTALAMAVLVYSLATGGIALAPNIATLLVLRFVAGIGTGGEWSIGFALLAEVWPRATRGAIGGLVAGMFNLGTFLAIGLYQSELGWRWAFGVMVFPAFLVAWIRRLVPESPVWLEFEAARRSDTLNPELAEAVRRPPLLATLQGGLRAVTLKAVLIFSLMNLGFYAFSTVFINYLQADASDGGLALDARGELPFQIVLNVASLVGVVLAGSLSDRLGRRGAFSLFCVLGGAGFVWLYTALGHSGPGYEPQVLLLMPFALCCAGFGINGVMGVLAPELYPTHLRSTGPGLCQNLGKGIGGLIGPPAAGALVPLLGFKTVLSLPGLVFVALAALIWWLPEVGGRVVRGLEDGAYLDPDRD